MMFLKDWKKLFLVVALVILSSCGTGCKEADDFGDSGDYAQISVYANSANCYYDVTKKVNENANATIVKCLKDSTLANSNFITERSEDITNFLSISLSDFQKQKCSAFDGNANFTYKQGEEMEGRNLIIAAYSACVTACQNKCSNSSSEDTQIWEKPDRKSQNGSNGIDISENTTFTVKAIGNVVLSSRNSNDSFQFYNRGKYENKKDIYLPASTSVDLNIDIKTNTNGATATSEAEKRAVLSRTYLEFNPVKRDYILNINTDGLSSDICPYLRLHPEAFQEANFASFTCDYFYSSSERAEDKKKLTPIQKDCKADYIRVLNNDNCSAISSDSSLLTIVSRAYSFNSLASTIDVFHGDNFYKYSNEIANYIVYKKSDGTAGSVDTIEVKEDGPTDSIEIKKFNENGYVVSGNYLGEEDSAFDDSYFWNTGDTFSILLSSPAKIAIKKLDNINEDTTCKYIVEENLSDTQQAIFGSDKTGGKAIEYNAKANANDNIWQVLKHIDIIDYTGTDNGTKEKEIVFNPFRTETLSDSKAKRTVTIKFTNLTKSDNCRKILIKLLPLKDFEVKNTGYLFFNIVDGTNVSAGATSINDRSVKLTILNKGALLAKNVTFNDNDKIKPLDEQYKINSFFELGESRYNNFNLTVQLTKTSELTTLDRMNSGYHGLVDKKSVFTRSGQVIRFDYSNWLDIDGKKEIKAPKDGYSWPFSEKTYTEVEQNEEDATEVTNTIQVPFGIGLIAVTKKTLPFICYGSITKTMSVSDKCLDINGTIVNDSDGKNSYCSIEESACTIGIDMQKSLDRISNECTLTSEDMVSGIDYSPVTIRSFLESLLTKDSSMTNKTCQDYITLINSTYAKASACLTQLESKGYNVYYATNNGNCDNSEGLNKDDESISVVEDTDVSVKKYCNPKTIDITLPSSTGCSDESCVTAAVIKLGNIFNVKKTNCREITTQTDDDSKETKCGFTSYFYYFKNEADVCGGKDNYITESKLCRVNGEPACYDLSNYRGSIKNFIKGINYTQASGIITVEEEATNGFIAPRDRKSGNGLGAQLVSNFNGNSGLMSENFSYESQENSEQMVFKYNEKLSLGNDSYITPFYINTYGQVTDGNYLPAHYEELKQLYKYDTTSTNPYLSILTANIENIRSGGFLSVIMGINDKDYFNTVPTGDDYIYLVKYTCGKDGNNNICALDEKSPAMFNSDGMMVLRSQTANSVLSTNQFKGLRPNGGTELLSKYIAEVEKSTNDDGSKRYANLFFKIIDPDENPGNNSGAYSVLINAAAEGQENVIITLFRKFFKTVLGFIDGSEAKLLIDNQTGNKVMCGSTTVTSDCSIFDEENIENNGNKCSANDSNCYKNCSEPEAGTTCKRIHDGKGFVKTIILKIIQNTLFNFIIKISFILMLAMYAFNFFLGRVEMAVPDLLGKIVKMCFVYFMLTESGWNMFNDIFIGFFKTGIDSLLFLIASSFDGSTTSMLAQAVAVGDYSDKLVLFETGLDNLQMIFSDTIMAKVAGLAFSSWYGLIYLYLVLTVLISYVIAVFTSIILYLNAQIYLSLAFTLFPLVLLFFIFDSTKASMDNWFKMIVGFTFQQIFMVLTISFFNNLIYNLIRNLFAYRVCWLPLFNLKFASFDFFTIRFWKIPNNAPFSSIGGTLTGGPSFYSILTFYIVGVLMGKFITGMTDLGNSIAGGGVGISGGIAKQINDGVASARKKLNDFAKDTGKQFISQTARRFGLDFGASAGTKYDNDAIKANKDRKAARQSVISSASTEANKKLSDYRNSDEFKGFVENTRNSSASKKEQDKEIENHLKNQQNRMFNSSAVANAMGNEYMLNKIGTTKEEYGNMTDDQKNVAQGKMREYLGSSGILHKERNTNNNVPQGEQKNYSLGLRTANSNTNSNTDSIGTINRPEGNTSISGTVQSTNKDTSQNAIATPEANTPVNEPVKSTSQTIKPKQQTTESDKVATVQQPQQQEKQQTQQSVARQPQQQQLQQTTQQEKEQQQSQQATSFPTQPARPSDMQYVQQQLQQQSEQQQDQQQVENIQQTEYRPEQTSDIEQDSLNQQQQDKQQQVEQQDEPKEEITEEQLAEKMKTLNDDNTDKIVTENQTAELEQ